MDVSLVKLIHFGSVVRENDEGVIGTVNYRDPKLFDVNWAKYKNDIFSLGLVFCYMLNLPVEFDETVNGDELVNNESVRNSAFEARNDRIKQKIDEIFHGISAFENLLKEVLVKMIEPDIDQRMQMYEVINLLSNYLIDNYPDSLFLSDNLPNLNKKVYKTNRLNYDLWDHSRLRLIV